ncbi:zinc knuckle domain-containing protein [Phlyctema vagabunda]|uniref:Zinc knuckle domain-containing protein n=1 Tax=Phlyctema vagabunda TaxID=108571 RepID=A0ABR4PGL8_9HELO
MEDDNMDSRTTGVGRKRALHEGTTYDESMVAESSEGEASSKRIKHMENSTAQPLSSAVEGGAPPTITWNQGVQSGLRTSFAKKKSRQPARPLAADGLEAGKELQNAIPPPVDDAFIEGGQSAILPSQNTDSPVSGTTGTTGTTSMHEEVSDDDSQDKDYNSKPSPPFTGVAASKNNTKISYGKMVAMLRTVISESPVQHPHVTKKKVQAAAKELSTTPQSDLQQAVQAAAERLIGERDGQNTKSGVSEVVPGVINGNGYQFRRTKKPKAVYQNSIGHFDMYQICTGSRKDITPGELRIHVFAPLFIWHNIDKVRKTNFTCGMVSSAFSVYLEKSFQAEQHKDRLRANAKEVPVQALLQQMLVAVSEGQSLSSADLWSSLVLIASKIEQISTESNNGSQKAKNTNPVEQLSGQKAQEVTLASTPVYTQNISNVGSAVGNLNSMDAPAVSLSYKGGPSDVETSISATFTSSTQAKIGKEVDPTPMEVGSNDALPSASHTQPSVSGAVPDLQNHTSVAEDLVLIGKYFPVPEGRPQVQLCLACSEGGHKAQDCPALICSKCNISGHNTLSCPLNKRCGRCRGLGHVLEQCPEKLKISRAEAVPCDLCDSTNHIETFCPSIWRSFNLKAENIRKVREIPIHCFCCGGTGHYGPECGLFKSQVLSGNETWSTSNWKQFVDFNSKERAISAGIDYSVPAKKRQEFSIKGKANDPIDLDDSDDSEPNFIRAKVNSTAQSKGHIRFGGYEDDRYLPREDMSSRRPGPAVPQYSNRSYQDDSARYGRERTFSPPPRYGNNGNQYCGSYHQLNDQPNDYYSVTHGQGPPQVAPPRGDITLGRGGQHKGKHGVTKAVERAAAKQERKAKSAQKKAEGGRKVAGNPSKPSKSRSSGNSGNPGDSARVTKKSRGAKRARGGRGH